MPRVYLSRPLGSSQKFDIDGDTARYLDSVLRVKKGDSFIMYDPSGEHFSAEVLAVSRGSIQVMVTERFGVRKDPPGGVELVMGVLKGAKMDLVIQKTVELGVMGIIPVETQRTVVKDTRKLDRWRKVALEAARQCGRAAPPPIAAPVGLRQYIQSASSMHGVLFYEGKGLMPLSPADATAPEGGMATVAIGPEGGFTPEEVDLMIQGGLVARTLGCNILRAETAAIASVTIMQYLMGRMGI